MAKQLLGKEVTAALNERIKADVAALKEKGVNPTLGIIRVGERPDDLSYERGATKRCETLGVEYKKYLLPEDVSQDELLKVIDEVNKDDNIHGVLMFAAQAYQPERGRKRPVCGERCRLPDRRFPWRRIYRKADWLPALYAPGLHGDSGSLRN